MTRSSLFALAGLGLALFACTPAAPLCTPGASVACVGPGGCAGGQVCNAAGSAFGACACGGTDAGPGGDAGRDAAQDDATMPADAGTDAPVLDAGVDADLDANAPVCDALTNVPCGVGLRCGWVRGSAGGVLGCIPDGTVATGGVCSIDTDGADNSQSGNLCLEGTCHAVCDATSASSCTPTGTCVRYEGMLTPDLGACQARCNPLTQERVGGSPCPGGEGCYELPRPAPLGPQFLCATAGTTPIGPIASPFFPNTCVPGAHVVRSANGVDFECAPYCAPTATSSSAPAGVHGVSPHTCAEQGGRATDDCVFNWYLSGIDASSTIQNEIGTCFEVTGRTYDDDSNPVTPELPYPSCADVAPTEAVAFGCVPSP